MWEILYGQPVAFEKGSELHFQLQICDGLRPHIIEGTAFCYADLMKKCWEKKPEKRPSISEIYDTFIKWQNDENTLSELSESDIRIQRIRDKNMQTCIETNYKSQFIPYSSDSVHRLLFTPNSELDCVLFTNP
ncbi:hypothetical protein C2G38_2081221 [Gigaspora rosea]|uniref:Serine-threonine/tyrosine-protein kinase catalytic domain-containing protein n=1 Tax=Gigaspora rosea TaxID=44941 RepID=A0A397VK42_9GLOM|nr:hypothetical protein C2G38_2081221 [Gigaspora rosea]